MFDSHCHLEFMNNAEKVAKEASKRMNGLVTSIAEPARKEKAMELKKKYPKLVHVAAGMHPTYVTEYSKEQINNYIDWIREHANQLVAIGEIGLDYHHMKPNNRAENVFIKFIQLAEEINKPIVIHVRNAFEDVLRILKQEKTDKVIIHCFTGSRKNLNTCLARNYMISYATLICYSSSVKKRAKQTPLYNMLLETDSPWLDPSQTNELTNRPWKIEKSAEVISKLIGKTKQEVLEITEKNARKIFEL